MKPVKRNGKRLLALTLAVLLCAALLPTAALAETYSGTTVRLEKTEGTVTVKNAAGEVKSLSGRPRLSGGWTVKTEAASYAWLSFDADSGNTLSVKLDANTLVEVRKNGGKNEVLLKNNGRLIAGSEKPLSGGQTLSVGNSSGVCGVRGSMLIATADQFMFLFGHGVASGRDGAAQKTELAAGQGVAYGAGGSMRRFEVQTAQISGFAQVELADNPALTQQMYEQTAGRLDLRELTAEQALQQQRTDEALAALLRSGLVTGSGSAEEGNNAEENGKRVDPAWGDSGLFNKSTTVYFDANGGTGYMAPVTVTSALQVPACEFTRDGYTFTGWKDDHGMDHPIGSPIQGGASGTFGEQLTLYAQWQANSGGGNVLPYVPAPEPVPEPQPQPEPEPPVTITVSQSIADKVTVRSDKGNLETTTDDKGNVVYSVKEDTALITLTYTDVWNYNNDNECIYGLYALGPDTVLVPDTLTLTVENDKQISTCTYTCRATENTTLDHVQLYALYSNEGESILEELLLEVQNGFPYYSYIEQEKYVMYFAPALAGVTVTPAQESQLAEVLDRDPGGLILCIYSPAYGDQECEYRYFRKENENEPWTATFNMPSAAVWLSLVEGV